MTATTERGLTFACGDETLVGVLAMPADNVQTVGVVIVVGGPQYRAGSHRQFVQLARRLAAAGHPTLRFDVRGMGDSTGEPRSFESIDDDLAAAVDALQRSATNVQRVVIWGLCDGASAALLYVQRRRDPRVAGLCLLNPWARSAETLARTQVRHYYRDRLRQREFWLKLLKGQVAGAALRGLWQNLRLALAAGPRREAHGTDQPYTRRMAQAWSAFEGPLLLVLSGQDYTAKEFLQACEVDPAWRGALTRPNVRRLDMAGADHTLSQTSERLRMEQAVTDWLAKCGAATPISAADSSLRQEECERAE